LLRASTAGTGTPRRNGSTSRWLDANPHDELAGEMRAELTAAPARHARYRREYLGWGVFALMNR